MTVTDNEELSLTLERHIAASPAKVYAAWLDPATLMRFLSNSPGMGPRHAETDPRIGGAFAIDAENAGRVVRHTGKYLSLVPHSEISFTWTSPYSTVENSTVTLTLRPNGAGTDLTLTHVRFVDQRHRDMHVGGWSAMLNGLSATTL